jgi:hypothetical protein
MLGRGPIAPARGFVALRPSPEPFCPGYVTGVVTRRYKKVYGGAPGVRWLLVLGLALDVLGTIWLLQGLNVLGGSPMTGDRFWAWMGLVLIVVGTLLLILDVRRSRRV